MRHLAVISLMIVATLIFQCQPAIGDDLADLKAANESLDKALTAGDADAIFEIWQDGAVMITGAGFPRVTNNATFQPEVIQLLEIISIQPSWYKIDYKVIGDTGLVWGVGIISITVKATNTVETEYAKICRMYAKSDGQWKIVMVHTSPIVLE